MSNRTQQEVDTSYVRGVLDSTPGLMQRLDEPGPGPVTEYWRAVIRNLCREIDKLHAEARRA